MAVRRCLSVAAHAEDRLRRSDSDVGGRANEGLRPRGVERAQSEGIVVGSINVINGNAVVCSSCQQAYGKKAHNSAVLENHQLTSWDYPSIRRHGQLVRGRAAVECEVCNGHTLLDRLGLGSSDEAKAGDEKAGELHLELSLIVGE